MFKSTRLVTVNLTVTALVITAFILGFRDRQSLDLLEVYLGERVFLSLLLLPSFFVMAALIPLVPILPLYFMSGSVFEGRILSFVVGLIGIILIYSISYTVGFHTGDLSSGRFKQYKQAKRRLYDLFSHTVRENGFRSLLLFSLSPFPQKLLGRICGYARLSFGRFLVASVIGSLPSLISITLLGTALDDPASPLFCFSLILTVLVSVISILIFYKTKLYKENSK